jgi:hypothetical protein
VQREGQEKAEPTAAKLLAEGQKVVQENGKIDANSVG